MLKNPEPLTEPQVSVVGLVGLNHETTAEPPATAGPMPQAAQHVAGACGRAPVASPQEEMILLLQAEVEQLQLDLAERDARLSEAMAWGNECSTAGNLDAGKSSEAEELALRLDELLDELQCCDEQVKVLEEQRRLMEEACEAEREERRQLEAWVNQIELRVAQRDQEKNAENENLRRRLEEATEARSRLEEQIKEASSQTKADRAHTRLLQTLRDENAQLRRRLEETGTARLQLENRLREVERQAAPENGAANVDNVLREERIRMAQERAELARQRTKLLDLQSELEQRSARNEKSLNDSDTRLRAFRDHLREIHEDEQRTRKENSLVSRISRLWNRLEG